MEEKQVSLNKILLPIMFVISAIILEITNFLYIGFTNSSGNRMALPTYFLFDLAIIIMLAGIIYIVRNKIASNIIFYFLLSLQFILNVVNSTMYSIFGDILSFDLLFLGAEATTAITLDFIDWIGLLINTVVFAIILTASIFLLKKFKGTYTVKKKHSGAIIALAFILVECLGGGLFYLQGITLQTEATNESVIEGNDSYLWDNFQFKIDAFKKFGHYGFYTKSIINLIFSHDVSEENFETYQSYIDEGYVESDETAPLYGDNLIVILCESLDWYAIDPINTPTIWELLNGKDSIVFSEFYARNRTNISEGIALLGNIPKDSNLKSAYNAGYSFDYSLPNLFKSTKAEEETVVTTFVHPLVETFYSRNVTHTPDGIGFDNFISYEDYTGDQIYEKFGEWITDYSFVQNQIDSILPDADRFLTFFSTLSTHGPYTYDNPYFEEYYDILASNFEEYAAWLNDNTDFIIPDNEGDFELFFHYKAAWIDFDRTISYLLEELENRGLSENTSIVFFADHNAYYTNLCYKIKGVEKSDYSNTYINNIPMMLYSPKLTKESGGYISDVFCNTFDILPTICDLYGLPSNNNLFQGYSVFSEDIKDSFFTSNLSGMFTNNIFSMNISDIVIVGENVTDEEIEHFKEIANKYFVKQEYIETIYKNGINGTIIP